MIRVLLGLILGHCLRIGCRRFFIPLPAPPKRIGALVTLCIMLGYIGADYLLVYQVKMKNYGSAPMQPETHASAEGDSRDRPGSGGPSTSMIR